MSVKAVSAVRRSVAVVTGRRIAGRVLLWLALGLGCCGCSALQLHRMESHAERGDYAWVAAQTIDCAETASGCRRLHRIKGDACFQLAASGRDPAGYYACAADELERGLAVASVGEAIDDQFNLQERLCESLMRLHALQSGGTADRTADRLMEAAGRLYQLAPESLPAVYYLSSARRLQIDPRLSALTAADHLPVCNRLKRTTTHVLSVMDAAKRLTQPEWERFSERYQRLLFDLGIAMQAAGCR